tara:strand:- start:45 stop:266 length:222 start_codon:yes stop_codon:yes gene_type:complete
LGGFYIVGTGVPVNAFKAYIWLSCSEISRNENPLNSQYEYLTPDEIAAGRRLLKDGCTKLTGRMIEEMHQGLR